MCKTFTTDQAHSTVPKRILPQQKKFMGLEENPVGTIFLIFFTWGKGVSIYIFLKDEKCVSNCGKENWELIFLVLAELDFSQQPHCCMSSI